MAEAAGTRSKRHQAQPDADPGMAGGDVGAAFADLTPAQAAEVRENARTVHEHFDDVLAQLEHQQKHGAPVTHGLLDELRAIRAKL